MRERIEFNSMYRFKFKTGSYEDHRIMELIEDSSGRIIYFITDEGYHINHDNVMRFRKVVR